MTKQNKKPDDSVLDDFEEIEDEIIRDKVREIFRDNPNNPMEALEDIGFTWYDDDYPSEEDEENSAGPENQNQEDLVEFFQGVEEPSDVILETFLAEKASDTPNLPLFRKYFRVANQNLKALILWALEHYPDRIDLLQDLGFFHEFGNILSTVIEHYTRACESQENMDTFTNLAQEFYYTTQPDGYDAYHALKDVFPVGSAKRALVDFLIAEEDSEDGHVREEVH
jgi:hypothetical protein